MSTVGVIIPVFNEEDALLTFHEQLIASIDQLPYQFLFYYINDGSTDCTGRILESLVASDSRVRIIELSRNFGHQAALTAGIDIAEGEWIISMDGDGQHPPCLIPEMLKLAESGYDMVLTQREDELKGSPFKRVSASLFYRFMNRIGDTQILPGGADFRLMSRTVVNSIQKMPEYHRFIRGMVAWVGFRTIILPYTPPIRLGGHSKYSLKKMVKLAVDAIFSFSLVPLYFGITAGVIMLFLAVVEVFYVLSFWFTGRQADLAPGWSSLMFVILIVGGILMILLGFIGIYIGFIFQEVKRRPVYMIRNMFSWEKPTGENSKHPTSVRWGRE